jgi:hypothetical protein
VQFENMIEVERMFGFGKKAKKLDGTDLLIIKTDEAKNRTFYQVAFPTMEALTGYDVLDDADMEAHPTQIQDFANILLRRLEALENSGKFEDSEDLAFIMGELTMLRDGSFVPQT